MAFGTNKMLPKGSFSTHFAGAEPSRTQTRIPQPTQQNIPAEWKCKYWEGNLIGNCNQKPWVLIDLIQFRFSECQSNKKINFLVGSAALHSSAPRAPNGMILIETRKKIIDTNCSERETPSKIKPFIKDYLEIIGRHPTVMFLLRKCRSV